MPADVPREAVRSRSSETRSTGTSHEEASCCRNRSLACPTADIGGCPADSRTSFSDSLLRPDCNSSGTAGRAINRRRRAGSSDQRPRTPELQHVAVSGASGASIRATETISHCGRDVFAVDQRPHASSHIAARRFREIGRAPEGVACDVVHNAHARSVMPGGVCRAIAKQAGADRRARTGSVSRVQPSARAPAHARAGT